MEGSIIAVIFAIIMIVTHIIKSIKEAAEVAKQQQLQQLKIDTDDDELVIVARSKPNRPPKASKQRPISRRPLEETLDIYDPPPKRQALSRALSPQGEGQRFNADPGTLDTTRIVAPTVDPTVKPELESITGIYEEGVQFADRSKSAISLDIADYLAKPEVIIQAVIFAEILNRPAWQESAGGKWRV